MKDTNIFRPSFDKKGNSTKGKAKGHNRGYGTQGGIKGDVKTIQNEKEYLISRYKCIDESNEYKFSRGFNLIEFLRKYNFKSEAIKYLRELTNIYIIKCKSLDYEMEYEKLFEEGKKLKEIAEKLKSKDVLNVLEKWIQ